MYVSMYGSTDGCVSLYYLQIFLARESAGFFHKENHCPLNFLQNETIIALWQSLAIQRSPGKLVKIIANIVRDFHC